MTGLKRFYNELLHIGDTENSTWDFTEPKYMALVTVSIYPKSITFSTKSGDRIHVVRVADEEQFVWRFSWLMKHIVDLYVPCPSFFFENHMHFLAKHVSYAHFHPTINVEYVEEFLRAAKDLKGLRANDTILMSPLLAARNLNSAHLYYATTGMTIEKMLKHAPFYPKAKAITLEIDSELLIKFMESVTNACENGPNNGDPLTTKSIYGVTGLVINAVINSGMSDEGTTIHSMLKPKMIHQLMACFPSMMQLEVQFYSSWYETNPAPTMNDMDRLIDTFNDIKAKLRSLIFGINVRVVYKVDIARLPKFVSPLRMKDYCVKGDLVVTHPEDSVICFETRDCRLTPTRTLKCFVRYFHNTN